MGKSRQVKALLESLPPQTHRFLVCRDSADRPGGLPVQSDGGDGAYIGFPPGKLGKDFAFRTYRKQGHLQLLYGVQILMSF